MLALAGLPALRTYPRDVATADASIHAVAAVRRTRPPQGALPHSSASRFNLRPPGMLGDLEEGHYFSE